MLTAIELHHIHIGVSFLSMYSDDLQGDAFDHHNHTFGYTYIGTYGWMEKRKHTQKDIIVIIILFYILFFFSLSISSFLRIKNKRTCTSSSSSASSAKRTRKKAGERMSAHAYVCMYVYIYIRLNFDRTDIYIIGYMDDWIRAKQRFYLIDMFVGFDEIHTEFTQRRLTRIAICGHCWHHGVSYRYLDDISSLEEYFNSISVDMAFERRKRFALFLLCQDTSTYQRDTDVRLFWLLAKDDSCTRILWVKHEK
jgi:hypothetical protein